MTPPALKFGLLGVLFVLQLGVPVWMIAHGEQVLKEGQRFQFESQPVDPFDAFRGRYVTLGLKADDDLLVVRDGAPPVKGGSVYVTVKKGADGFAVLDGAYVTPPTDTPAYLQLKVLRVEDEQRVQVQLPFERYYLEEKRAPEAEAAYRKHSQSDAKTKAYITVKIREGQGQLEELYIGELPIRQFLAQEGHK